MAPGATGALAVSIDESAGSGNGGYLGLILPCLARSKAPKAMVRGSNPLGRARGECAEGVPGDLPITLCELPAAFGSPRAAKDSVNSLRCCQFD